jgi:hypothetical protein
VLSDCSILSPEGKNISPYNLFSLGEYIYDYFELKYYKEDDFITFVKDDEEEDRALILKTAKNAYSSPAVFKK